jgi:hypothetical protein
MRNFFSSFLSVIHVNKPQHNPYLSRAIYPVAVKNLGIREYLLGQSSQAYNFSNAYLPGEKTNMDLDLMREVYCSMEETLMVLGTAVLGHTAVKLSRLLAPIYTSSHSESKLTT